jgi:arylsulfatase A-like enzyme
LLEALDTYIGKGNYTLFLTADHGVGEVPQYLIDNKVPAGIFSDSVLVVRTTEYLNKIYGEANWIVAARNDQIYLDHELIGQKNIELSEIQDKLAYFVNHQEGIAETYTATQFMKQEYTGFFSSKLQNGFNFKLSGDVRYILEPGWYAGLTTCATHNTAYNYDSHVPLIFYGKGIIKGVSYEYHTITDIAPTVSMLLNIKLPSAATGKPIKEILE